MTDNKAEMRTAIRALERHVELLEARCMELAVRLSEAGIPIPLSGRPVRGGDSMYVIERLQDLDARMSTARGRPPGQPFGKPREPGW